MIFLNFFIGILVLCLLAADVQSDNFESNLKVSLSGAIFEEISADDATINPKIADELTTDPTLENTILEETSIELLEEVSVELNNFGEPQMGASDQSLLENEVELADLDMKSDPTITDIGESTTHLDSFEENPQSPPLEDQGNEREGEYESLATAYEQITKDTDAIQTELVDARNRLIAYLEADILSVANGEAREKDYRELTAEFKALLVVNDALRREIIDLSSQTEGATPVGSVNNQDYLLMKAELEKLQFFHEDLVNENEGLRIELAQLRAGNNVPASDTEKLLQEVTAQNEQLSSQLAESHQTIISLTAAALSTSTASDPEGVTNGNDELLTCLSALESTEEASKTCATKLLISKNTIAVEKLSTENAKMELDVITRESSSRISKLEKEAKVFAQQVKVKNTRRCGTPVPAGDARRDTASSSDENILSAWMTSLYESFHPYTSAVMQYGGAGILGALTVQKSVLAQMQTPVTEAFAGLAPYYNSIIGALGPFVSAALSRAGDLFDMVEGYYSDTLLPLFHDTVVPLMSKLNFKATRFVSAKWSVLRSFYSESIHAPASALYEAHLAVHVNTLSRNIKEFYDKNLKEFVDLHIAPSVVACSAKLAHALSGAGVLLAGLNLHLVPESMTNTFLQYRSALIAFLKANETVRNTFGEHTDSVVVTLVNFVPAFLVYILLQLLLTFVISVAVGPKRRKSERTHGEERASIRFMRKGSQEHLDIKGEHEKDVTSTVGGDALDKAVGAKDVSSVVSKTDGTLLGEKNGTQCLSPLRTPRTSNLPNKSPKGPNSPYSGIPLSKTGG